MSKLLPILLILLGIAVGGGAGYVMRPAVEVAEDCADTEHGQDCAKDSATEHVEPTEPDAADLYYAKLTKQFVVPVVKDRKVSALVVMSLSIETTSATRDVVFEREPKLRDALLAVMFLHANSGGFEGQFTGGEAMKDLRGSMLEAAQRIIGPDVHSVLVTDILRQDV